VVPLVEWIGTEDEEELVEIWADSVIPVVLMDETLATLILVEGIIVTLVTHETQGTEIQETPEVTLETLGIVILANGVTLGI
jgi:hypothetical protein